MLHRILNLPAFVTIVCTIFLGCGEKTTNPLRDKVPLLKKTPSQVVGIVSGQSITRQDMWAALIEASGSEIFREILLSHAIQRALTQEQLPEITKEELAYEKNILFRTLQDNNASDLDLLLSQRGYGEKRLYTLCQRNAGLRKLVQSKIKVTDASVRRMFALIHGPKFPIRVIVTSTLEQASKARKKIQDGERFSTVAATLSIDPSAVRGGLVAPLSPADPLWPTSIRELIQTLEIGVCSPPVLIENRWVMIKVLDHPITQTVDLSEVRKEMHKLSRLAMEQLEMDQLSNRLRDTKRSTIIDLDMKRALKQK